MKSLPHVLGNYFEILVIISNIHFFKNCPIFKGTFHTIRTFIDIFVQQKIIGFVLQFFQVMAPKAPISQFFVYF